MTRITRNIPADCCCDSWKKGIRTINGQYPDDNREFGIVEGAGILITPVTAGIKITNAMGAIEAGQNIEITNMGDHLEVGTTDDIIVENATVNADLNVNGNIYQQGASYESHMEQVYTADDYIIMRDGAVAALATGQYAGFQVKKYDGTNDGRLVIDKTGTARVGDVGDEQPLLTRAESANLSDGDVLVWDAANSKAIKQTVESFNITPATITGLTNGTTYCKKCGKMLNITLENYNITDYTAISGTVLLSLSGIGTAAGAVYTSMGSERGVSRCVIYIGNNSDTVRISGNANGRVYGTITIILN